MTNYIGKLVNSFLVNSFRFFICCFHSAFVRYIHHSPIIIINKLWMWNSYRKITYIDDSMKRWRIQFFLSSCFPIPFFCVCCRLFCLNALEVKERKKEREREKKNLRTEKHVRLVVVILGKFIFTQRSSSCFFFTSLVYL